jgi:short-subunit dehydrogenase
VPGEEGEQLAAVPRPAAVVPIPLAAPVAVEEARAGAGAVGPHRAERGNHGRHVHRGDVEAAGDPPQRLEYAAAPRPVDVVLERTGVGRVDAVRGPGAGEHRAGAIGRHRLDRRRPDVDPDRHAGGHPRSVGRRRTSVSAGGLRSAAVEWGGTTTIVTGASRGIGRAVAEAAAARGARVGVIARSEDGLREVVAGLGGDARYAVADVADPGALTGAIAHLEAELGPTDVMVANAGIGAYGAFADLTAEEAERLVRVNVLGTVHALRAVVPGMIERRRGHLVTIGSIAGRIGSPFEAMYSATKFAGVGLTEALVVELEPYGIGVSVVNPGPVATDFGAARGHPYDRERPRPVPAEDVARAVVRAVEEGRHESYVPGSFRPAVAIRHLVPPVFRWGTRRSFTRELAADRKLR